MSSAKFWKTVAANAIGNSLAGFVAVFLNGNGLWPTTSTRLASDYSTPIDYSTPLVPPKDGKQRVGGPTADSGSVDTYPKDYGYADYSPGYTDHRYAPKPKLGRITDRRSLGYVDTPGDNLGYVDTYGRR